MILRNPYFSLDGNELSGSIRSMSIPEGWETPDNTTGGQNTRTVEKGLKTWSISITLEQDFDDNEVFDRLQAAYDSTDPVALIIRPTSAVRGVNNPQFDCNAHLTSFDPIGQSVGDYQEVTAEFMAAGDLAVSTS